MNAPACCQASAGSRKVHAGGDLMNDEHCAACSSNAEANFINHAERLTALAREARLLELGLEGGGSDAARLLAADLEVALSTAMDADSPTELTQARLLVDAVLAKVVNQGMRLTAEMTDMEVQGVLGTSRMAVLTAVLSATD
jgi:hypothetical protein